MAPPVALNGVLDRFTSKVPPTVNLLVGVAPIPTLPVLPMIERAVVVVVAVPSVVVVEK